MRIVPGQQALDFSESTIPAGFCQCGCGQKTKIATKTDRTYGWVRGVPFKYVVGHNPRLKRTYYEERDCGYHTPCWVWLLGKKWSGYGATGRKGHGVAHRYYWEQANGPIPEGLELDHLCRNRACVRPDHLEPVTHEVNMQRAAQNKLTLEDAIAIRASTEPAVVLAAHYNISISHLSEVRQGKVWKNAGTPIRKPRPRLAAVEPPNPSGLCQCGCGGITPVATRSRAYVSKGQHMRYIHGHNHPNRWG